MKNITLSVPEDIIRKSREYAKKHGTTLNEMVRQFLTVTVSREEKTYLNDIDQHLNTYGVKTRSLQYKRDDLHER